MKHPHKYQIDKRQAAAEGEKFAALFRGHCDARRGLTECPYPAGSPAAVNWQAGQEWHRMGAEA